MSSIKEILIDKTASDLGQTETLTREVLAWCFRDVTKAVHTYEAIELSGLGKLMISQNKLRKKIKKIEGIVEKIESNPEILNREVKLADLKEMLVFLYSKLKTNDEKSEANGGRMEELDTPSRGTKGTNS